MSHGYDQFCCPVEGCEWSCAWPCQGGCEHGASLSTVPLLAVATIGEHRIWHENGHAAMRWDEDAKDFVEVTDVATN